MKKTVIDMCPFMGLKWQDSDENIHYKGEGLEDDENNRLDEYFAKFVGQAFDRNKSIELAQMALDNEPIPKGWQPNNKEEK